MPTMSAPASTNSRAAWAAVLPSVVMFLFSKQMVTITGSPVFLARSTAINASRARPETTRLSARSSNLIVPMSSPPRPALGPSAQAAPATRVSPRAIPSVNILCLSIPSILHSRAGRRRAQPVDVTAHESGVRAHDGPRS